MRLLEYIRLIRIHQWYKNLVIFLALFFIGELFKTAPLEKIFFGFIALCLISSTNYIINDMIDVKKDRLHPEKRNRPLAKKSITIIEAVIIAVIFFISSLSLGYYLGVPFFLVIIFIFISTLAYSLGLKNEPVLDIIMIATNFVVRAVSGALILKVMVSPWLVLCPFFLALFLAVGKRDSEIRVLKNKASSHKEVLKYYTPELISALMIISTTCLIIAYSLYAFSKTTLLLITIPFALYSIFRFYYLVNIGSEIAHNPEMAYKDWHLVISGLAWVFVIFYIFYILDHALLIGFLLN